VGRAGPFQTKSNEAGMLKCRCIRQSSTIWDFGPPQACFVKTRSQKCAK